MFKKKDHLVGLDIGSRTIKAGEISETKKGYRLESFGTIDIAPGLIEEGTIKDPVAVADSIRQLWKNQNIREVNVALSIGGYSVIVKPISMDMMSEEQVHQSIHFEAEQYVPFDINDVNLDFHVLGESLSNPNKIDVILVAAKKELVNDFVDLVRMAGLNPCIIDHELFALQNIFEMNYETGEESVALIDIGASKTYLNILKGNTSLLTRDFSLGCGQIDAKIISLLDCSYEEAEAIKRGSPSDSISTADLREIISTVVHDWTTEIRRGLDYFYSAFPEDRIEKIYLSGGGAHVKEIHHMLSQEAGADVETLNSYANLTVNSERIDAAYLERIAPQATICLGLALRRVDDK